MHNDKIIAVLLCCTILNGCSFFNASGNAELEALREDYAQLKESNDALKQSYISQNEDVSRILDELNAISGRTAALRGNMENGSADMAQADRIFSNIQDIRKRIEKLESSYASAVAKNREFAKMIDGFKKLIEDQEGQIDALKKEIEARDNTIAKQSETIEIHENTIERQDETIRRQNEELSATVAKQARMLYEAGAQLEEIGDNAPDVSWKKNKEKIDVMIQDIYKKALMYYQQSYEDGYSPALEAIAKIQTKIQAQ